MIKRFYLALLVWALLTCGVGLLATAQVPLTGAGKGAPGGGGNSVILDQVGTAGGVNGTGLAVTAASITVTAALTDPALLVVFTNSDGTSVTSPAATWGAQSMTVLINQNATGGRQVIIFGLRNPTSGSQSLVVSWTGAISTGAANAISFSHVNQTNDATAFPNFAGSNSGATPDSITITTGAGNYAIAGYSSSANFASVSDNQLFLDNTGNVWAVAANYKAATGATDTLTGSPGSATSTIAGGAVAHD